MHLGELGKQVAMENTPSRKPNSRHKQSGFPSVYYMERTVILFTSL